MVLRLYFFFIKLPLPNIYGDDCIDWNDYEECDYWDRACDDCTCNTCWDVAYSESKDRFIDDSCDRDDRVVVDYYNEDEEEDEDCENKTAAAWSDGTVCTDASLLRIDDDDDEMLAVFFYDCY